LKKLMVKPSLSDAEIEAKKAIENQLAFYKKEYKETRRSYDDCRKEVLFTEKSGLKELLNNYLTTSRKIEENKIQYYGFENDKDKFLKQTLVCTRKKIISTLQMWNRNFLKQQNKNIKK
jgi:hypothetical protein